MAEKIGIPIQPWMHEDAKEGNFSLHQDFSNSASLMAEVEEDGPMWRSKTVANDTLKYKGYSCSGFFFWFSLYNVAGIFRQQGNVD
jgi:hypothetical protein